MEPTGVVEGNVNGNPFLVHIGFHMQVADVGGTAENQVHMAENSSKGVLGPGEAYGHFARVYKTIVSAIFAFASKINAAIGIAHVGDSDAKDVFSRGLYGLLGFKGKGGVGAKMGTQADSVEPDGGMGGDSFET